MGFAVFFFLSYLLLDVAFTTARRPTRSTHSLCLPVVVVVLVEFVYMWRTVDTVCVYVMMHVVAKNGRLYGRKAFTSYSYINCQAARALGDWNCVL